MPGSGSLSIRRSASSAVGPSLFDVGPGSLLTGGEQPRSLENTHDIGTDDRVGVLRSFEQHRERGLWSDRSEHFGGADARKTVGVLQRWHHRLNPWSRSFAFIRLRPEQPHVEHRALQKLLDHGLAIGIA